VPLLDLKAQYAAIREELRAAIDRVAESQHFILGPEVEGLESEVAAYSQCEFGIGVSSGSDALLVALMAIDFKPGDEVITTPYTFFATAGAVSRLGGKPVFIDIDPLTYNIDPAAIEAAVTERTRAIMPVHLYGQMADMDPIMEAAARHGLVVIEDAAQAIGSEYKGRRAGSIGDIGCFSFYPGKNLGAYGEGGAVTTSNPEYARKLRMLRDWGTEQKYVHELLGFNYRLEEIQAAILQVKLRRLEDWTEARRANASRYDSLLTGSVPTPFAMPDVRHVYHIYAIRTGRRAEFQDEMKTAGIATGIHYPIPVHLQPACAVLGYSRGDFPHAERAADEVLSLPMFAELTEEQIEVVANAVKASAPALAGQSA